MKPNNRIPTVLTKFTLFLLVLTIAFTLLHKQFLTYRKPEDIFTFSKETKNYVAYAAEKTRQNRHRLRLSLDRDYVDFSLTPNNQSSEKSARDTYADYSDNPGKMIENGPERVVVFENLFHDTDFRYNLTEGGFDQQIVLKTANATHGTYTFTYSAPHLSAQNRNKGVWYFEKNDSPIFRIPKGWAKDARGAFTNNVTVYVTDKTIKIVTDPTWLTSPDRSYPIVIDSSIEITPEKRATSKP